MTDYEVYEEQLRIKEANVLFTDSAHTYVSGRILTQSNSIQGAILQTHAIEKLLKAIIKLHYPKKEIKIFWHEFIDLFNAVSKIEGYEVENYKSYVPKLKQIYAMRYPDNLKEEFIYTPKDTDMLDEIYITLTDQIKIIPQIKYHSGLFPFIYSPYRSAEEKNWVTIGNRALLARYKKWKTEYESYCLRA